MRKNILKLFETSCSGMERSGMEWKDGRKQHPGGMGEVFPHINNMSDQRFRSRIKNRAISETIYPKNILVNLIIYLDLSDKISYGMSINIKICKLIET